LGYQVALHLSYFRKSQIRYYYYNNRADPLAINSLRLYGWRTRFHSMAWQYKFNSDTRLITQLLFGDTLMGPGAVDSDYWAHYLMLSHRVNQHRISLRYDRFMAVDKDQFNAITLDYNDSDGWGWTLNWRYQIDPNWQVGLEYHTNRSYAVSDHFRPSFPNRHTA
jgi:hypothetical protein